MQVAVEVVARGRSVYVDASGSDDHDQDMQMKQGKKEK